METLRYMEKALSADERALDLVGRMTVEDMVEVLAEPLFCDLSEETTDANNERQKSFKAKGWGVPKLTMRITEGGFEKEYPDALGMAAIVDAGRVENYCALVSKIYRKAGIIMTNSPLIGVASNTEFADYKNTFGMNFGLVCDYGKAYASGMQETEENLGWGEESVMCVADGWLGKTLFSCGSETVYPGRNQGMQIRTFTEGVFSLSGKTKETAGIFVDKSFNASLFYEQCNYGGIVIMSERLKTDEILGAVKS